MDNGLTHEQHEAFQAIKSWQNSQPYTPDVEPYIDNVDYGKRDDNWHFKLGGFAGTGKTTLITALAKNGDIVCAPTGKAVSVLEKLLRRKGIKPVTIHSALYLPNPPDRTLYEELTRLHKENPKDKDIETKLKAEVKRLDKLKTDFEAAIKQKIKPGDFLIIDESSMLKPKIVHDIKKTGCYALFVGDPGQLPPVNDDEWFSEGNMDYTLKAPLRHKHGDAILNLSTFVRNNIEYNYDCHSDDCQITNVIKLKAKDIMDADQIIVGKNQTRWELNRWIREKLNFEDDMPLEGDRIICLKNEVSEEFAQMGNEIVPTHIRFTHGTQCDATSDARYDSGKDEWTIDLDYEGISLIGVRFNPYHIRQNYGNNPSTEAKPIHYDGTRHLDYSYAITVHKAQGSEWDNVVILDDGIFGNRKQRKDKGKWRYTAITRAKRKLTIVDRYVNGIMPRIK